MSFYVYILRSLKNGSFYKGQTDDIERRLEEHNSGNVKATAPFIPWELVCCIEKPTRSEACILERKLKNITSKEKIILFIEKYKSIK